MHDIGTVETGAPSQSMSGGAEHTPWPRVMAPAPFLYERCTFRTASRCSYTMDPRTRAEDIGRDSVRITRETFQTISGRPYVALSGRKWMNGLNGFPGEGYRVAFLIQKAEASSS